VRVRAPPRASHPSATASFGCTSVAPAGQRFQSDSVSSMATRPASPQAPLLLADGSLDEDIMGGQSEASDVCSIEETMNQSTYRDYVPLQKRLMDRMNHMLGEQHLKNWYSKIFVFIIIINIIYVM
jgi:hypothetical protein